MVLGRGQAIAWAGLPGLGFLALAIGCGAKPPAFPDSGPGLGSATETGGSVSGPDGDGGPASAGDDAGTVGANTGGAMGDDTAGGGDDAGSTAGGPGPAGGSSDGAAASDGGSSGAPVEDPWFVGHYEGTWGGSCSAPDPIGNVDGDGTWQVDIDADGNIVGTYEGSVDIIGGVDGNIVGTIDESGVQMATAEGDALGACSWDGLLTMDGNGDGDINCGDCDGSWQGSAN